ncbi:hypothetical protein AGMMS49579_17020 [Spirochaetia bacterium]|nr:hypothetical protein AGMMS49579_17020 [Spirochaetia bacterium]
MTNIDIFKKSLAVFIGLLTVFGVIFGLYTWFYEKKPNLDITIINEFNVLELRRNVNELYIMYKDNDLEQTKENIRIINIKIENNGNADILKSMFDDTIDWGIQINKGEILSFSVLSASNKYISENLLPINIDNKIIFKNIIIETKEYFIVEIMILMDEDELIDAQYFGKIAGINSENITINKKTLVEDLTFLEKFIYGGVGINILRFLIIPLIAIIIFCIIIVIAPIPKITQYSSNTRVVVAENGEKKVYRVSKQNGNALYLEDTYSILKEKN